MRKTLELARVVTTRHDMHIVLETYLHTEKHATISNLSAVAQFILKWKIRQGRRAQQVNLPSRLEV